MYIYGFMQCLADSSSLLAQIIVIIWYHIEYDTVEQ